LNPVEPRVEGAWFQSLKLKYDELSSNFAFKFDLRCYTMAMCYCNRLTTSPGGGGISTGAPRILCLTGSEDSSAQYIAMMNAIFSAQRAGRAAWHSFPFQLHFGSLERVSFSASLEPFCP
jgi:hypothetical protein